MTNGDDSEIEHLDAMLNNVVSRFNEIAIRTQCDDTTCSECKNIRGNCRTIVVKTEATTYQRRVATKK